MEESVRFYWRRRFYRRGECRYASTPSERVYVAAIFLDARAHMIVCVPARGVFSFLSSANKSPALSFQDLVSSTQSRSLDLTLIGVLFAFAYDLRTTQGDPTTESAWTIASLCPAFSALDVSYDLESTLVTSYRRALAFPLYRNWNLCERCRKDVGDILKGGVRGVTRALLQTKKLLDRHETYYVYSKIWLNDFIVWAQSHKRYAATESGLAHVSLVGGLHGDHRPPAQGHRSWPAGNGNYKFHATQDLHRMVIRRIGRSRPRTRTRQRRRRLKPFLQQKATQDTTLAQQIFWPLNCQFYSTPVFRETGH